MPSLNVDLEPGKTVMVKLVKDGYLAQTFSYTVPATATTVTKTMVAEKYEMLIDFYGTTLLDKHEVGPGVNVRANFYVRNTGDVASTAFVRIYLDEVLDIEFGTPSISPGSRLYNNYTLSSTAVGTHTVKVEVGPSDKSVTDTKTDTFTVKPTTGTLSVSTSPTSATVKVGTETKTSPCNFTLAPGTHTVTISKSGYEPRTESVNIISGATTTKSYTLTPTPGTLAVTTTPTGASVKVGTETKTSPCTFSLAPGTYTVTVSKSGYDTKTDTGVTITSGATTTKSYTLVLSEVTITFDTKKEDGTTLTGVEVFVDGVKKGTT